MPTGAHQTVLRGADRYRAPGDLGVVACFFNPAGWRTKPDNFNRFLAPVLAGGMEWRAVECAFGDEPFVLGDHGGRVLRVRGRDVLWQKERLLNLAASALPDRCRKVAWLDGDVLLADPDWAVKSSALLADFAVVQPFDVSVRLPRGATDGSAGGIEARSFAAVLPGRPQGLLDGDFHAHGHTGFAWAARRELFAGPGLYDGCVTGSADHVMAHAFAGDWDGPCIAGTFYRNTAHRRHFAAWAARAYPPVRARIGCVPGALLHLWHGEAADRRYVVRNRELAGFGFDPVVDLRPGPGGCWEWNTPKTDLHRWAEAYFRERREDGPAGAATAEGPQHAG